MHRGEELPSSRLDKDQKIYRRDLMILLITIGGVAAVCLGAGIALGVAFA